MGNTPYWRRVPQTPRPSGRYGKKDPLRQRRSGEADEGHVNIVYVGNGHDAVGIKILAVCWQAGPSKHAKERPTQRVFPMVTSLRQIDPSLFRRRIKYCFG